MFSGFLLFIQISIFWTKFYFLALCAALGLSMGDWWKTTFKYADQPSKVFYHLRYQVFNLRNCNEHSLNYYSLNLLILYWMQVGSGGWVNKCHRSLQFFFCDRSKIFFFKKSSDNFRRFWRSASLTFLHWIRLHLKLPIFRPDANENWISLFIFQKNGRDYLLFNLQSWKIVSSWKS